VLDALVVRGIDNNSKKRIVGIAQGWQLGRAIKTLDVTGGLTRAAPD